MFAHRNNEKASLQYDSSAPGDVTLFDQLLTDEERARKKAEESEKKAEESEKKD